MSFGISLGRTNRWLFALFLFVLPLGTRLLLVSFTGAPPNDGNAAFLYLSDLALGGFITAVALGYFRKRLRPSLDAPTLFLLGLLTTALASVAVAKESGLALWQTLKLLEGVLLFLGVRTYFRHQGSLQFPLIALVSAGLLQSTLGILQFDSQASLGLTYLGEPSLGRTIPGAGKFLVEGAKVVRSAGTLPHANVLAAFISASLLALTYLWFRYHKKLGLTDFLFHPFSTFRYIKENIGLLLFGAVALPILLTLVLSFSRTGWAVFIVIFAFAAFWILRYHREYTRAFLLSGAAIGALLAVFTVGFFPYIKNRIPLSDEPAILDRLLLNRAALTMIQERPWLGVGMGNFVLNLPGNLLISQSPNTSAELSVALSQSKGNLPSVYSWWEQPVHNVFLLVAAELGLVGLLLFLAFMAALFWRASWLGGVVLLGLGVIMMTDHYLWTMQQGRLLFWLGLGVAAGTSRDKEIESSRS